MCNDDLSFGKKKVQSADIVCLSSVYLKKCIYVAVYIFDRFFNKYYECNTKIDLDDFDNLSK